MTNHIPPSIVLEGLHRPLHGDDIHWPPDMIQPLFLYETAANQMAPFFTSFIFKPLQTKQKRYVCGIQSAYRHRRHTDNDTTTDNTDNITNSDWLEWIDALFTPAHWLHALAGVSYRFAHWHPHVWIMLPYPHPHAASASTETPTNEAPPPNDPKRMEALTKWMDEFIARWQSDPALNHVHLGGFVWGRESIPLFDRSLVMRWNAAVHQKQLRTMWLANYKGLFVDQWRDLGFDHCSIFAQYTGATEHGPQWVADACNFSLVHGTGLQIVCGKGIRFDRDHLDVYLHQKVVYKQLGGAGPLIYRFPNHSLYELYNTNRSIYDQLFFSIS